jgi:hypothetical protein
MNRADVQAMFRRERARFERVLGPLLPPRALPELVLVDVRCPAGAPCRERDLAYAEAGTRPRIVLATRALRLPAANVRGLLRHELGHAYDPWLARPGREQRADDLAEYVTGAPIRYDARDIQTTGRGTWPRPRRLHA